MAYNKIYTAESVSLGHPDALTDFIANANSGSRRLYVSGHVIILNWNSRAAEIINDMLYCEERKNIVVLSNRKQSEIEKEISDYISDTVTNENKLLAEQCAGMSFFKKIRYLQKHLMHNNLTFIVREGDTYSSKQLRDISLEHAEAVIILGRDEGIGSHKPDDTERRGNAHTVKTLVQVAEITGAEDSDNDQKIVVEVDDEWTMDLVDKIIDTKQVDGKCIKFSVRYCPSLHLCPN